MRGAFIFLARRPGGGITELRTHEQGCVGVGLRHAWHSFRFPQ